MDPGYNSCPYCGNKIEWPELKQEQAEELRNVPYNDEFRFCIRCGRRLDPETHVCPSCGYRYAAAQEQSAEDPENTESAGRYPSDRVPDDGYEAYSRGDSPERTGSRSGADPIRMVGKAAGKVVRGAAAAIPSGGGGMSGKNKKNKRNKKKNTGKIVVLSVIGMMALFAVTFVIFFYLLGGSFSSDEPTASPSVSPSSSPAAAEWTPSISTRAPATQRPQSAGTTRKTPEPTRRPAPTPEPVPTQEPEEEIPEPENGMGNNEQEQQSVQDEPASGNENILDVE